MAKRRLTPDISKAAGKTQKVFVSRFGYVFSFCSLIAVCIGYMLFSTTVVHADRWVFMGDSTLYSVKPIEPSRGEILASDGSILATNLYFYNIMIDFRAEGFKIIEFDNALPELCDSLAKYYPPHNARAWRKRFDEQMKKPKNKRTRNFVLVRNGTKYEENRILKTFPFFRDFKRAGQHGLKSDAVLRRTYPFGSMARLSIGRVGQTAECSEVHGRSGLECALDPLLYGKKGTKVRGRNSMRPVQYVTDTPAVRGYDVYTTIDIRIQDILESELGAMLLESEAEWGTAMIMDVATGDIKAMSNLELDTKSATPRYIEALNRCVLAYEPGSVMKVMSMALALNKGFADPNRVYQVGHTYMFQGRPIRDTHSPATLPVEQFIEYSSNIGMVKMVLPHYASNPADFKNDLAEMGFFDTFNTGIAGETTPRFLRDPKLIDLSRMIFGYTTAIPPLYTCAFYNAIANDGKFVRPRLVRGLRKPDGTDSVIPVDYIRDRILTSEQAATLRRMMRRTVWEKGGTATILKSDLVEIAGKTGTARIAKERPKVDANGDSIDPKTPWKGGYRENAHRVAFCGFFPYENPKYTCIVVISHPKGAKRGPSASAGMVLKNVALKLYARSMLTDNPEFVECAADKRDQPLVYSSFDDRRAAVLHQQLDLPMSKIRRPAEYEGNDIVPDVTGVSIREALTKLESRGYAVEFSGMGYVAAQTPEPGTQAGPGTKVKLTLRYD